MVVDFKRAIYNAVIKEFRPLIARELEL